MRFKRFSNIFKIKNNKRYLKKSPPYFYKYYNNNY